MVVAAGAMSAQMAPAAQIGLWVAALIGLCIGVFVVMVWLRGRWLEGASGSAEAQPMSLDEIRRLHRLGAITDAERDALRAQTLSAGGAQARAARASATAIDPSREGAGDSRIRRAHPGYDLSGEPLPQALQAERQRRLSDDAAERESEGT